MPELPDIAAYIGALEPRIVGQPLEQMRIASAFLLRTAQPPIESVEGHVVRELRRIERALATRSMPRVARVDDAAAAEASDTATLVPPPIPETEQQLMSAAATGAEVPVEDTALERLRAKRPPIPRVENGQLAEAADVSFALREVAGLEDGIAEGRSAAAVGRGTNGTAAPARIVPRIDARARDSDVGHLTATRNEASGRHVKSAPSLGTGIAGRRGSSRALPMHIPNNEVAP